jgi:hypothetical protein
MDGHQKPHVDHQKIMLKIKALPSPSPLFASRVKSEALVHRKRLLGETCWGTKIPPWFRKAQLKGAVFLQKPWPEQIGGVRERQHGHPSFFERLKTRSPEELIATTIHNGLQVGRNTPAWAKPKVACAGSNCPGHLGGLGFVDPVMLATSLFKAVSHN